MGKAQRQRQAAQVVRAQLAAEQRKKRTLIAVGVAAAVVIVGGAIGYGIYQGNKSSTVNEPTAATVNYGFESGEGPVAVDLYVDFMCPSCKAFEEQYAEPLQQAALAGQITLITHPVAILNRMSQGTDYSTRAGAASVCAANEGKFGEFSTALFAAQPAEQTPGLSNGELVDVGKGVGLGDTFASCVNAQTYAAWVDKGTEVASEDGLSGTPYVKINGEPVELKDFGTALDAAINAAGVGGVDPSASAS
ncbi:thioredoxin domain-containing protein [Phytomonospora sp. NPDC050363]|uniref:DsbA family protein n=1 Tax=Phytomonospora sp. NPDC050363 TaxID=3155642 RepID=UPI0033DD5A21